MGWGWVEILKSSDEEQYRLMEQMLSANQIRYRVYVFSHANKALIVGSQMATQSISRGPNINPGGLYAQHAENNDEPIYTVEIRRRDLKHYRAAKTR